MTEEHEWEKNVQSSFDVTKCCNNKTHSFQPPTAPANIGTHITSLSLLTLYLQTYIISMCVYLYLRIFYSTKAFSVFLPNS